MFITNEELKTILNWYYTHDHESLSVEQDKKLAEKIEMHLAPETKTEDNTSICCYPGQCTCGANFPVE